MNQNILLTALLNEESLVDTKEKDLYIPDISSDPFHIYGFQVADLSTISSDEIRRIIQEEETLTSYAMAYLPAPGTSAPNRMRFYPFDDIRTDKNCDDTFEEQKQQYTSFLNRYKSENKLSDLVPESEYIKQFI